MYYNQNTISPQKHTTTSKNIQPDTQITNYRHFEKSNKRKTKNKSHAFLHETPFIQIHSFLCVFCFGAKHSMTNFGTFVFVPEAKKQELGSGNKLRPLVGESVNWLSDLRLKQEEGLSGVRIVGEEWNWLVMGVEGNWLKVVSCPRSRLSFFRINCHLR